MEGKNTVFDIFIRNYESGKPVITMTVSGGMTIGKLKRAFTENCKLFFLSLYKLSNFSVNYRIRCFLPRKVTLLVWWHLP